MRRTIPLALLLAVAVTSSVVRRRNRSLARLAVALLLAVGWSADAAAQCVVAGGANPAPPKIVHVDPVYPPAAIAAQVQGVVILQIQVSDVGAVSSPTVLRSIPLLDAAALAAVVQWQYAARPPGSPCLLLTVTVNFVLPVESAVPTNLQASVVGNQLTLTWVPPTTPPSGYLIEAGTGPGLSNIASVPVGPNPPGIAAPVPNGTYFIRVRAIYPSGTGSPSNEVSVTVGCGGPPPAPLAFAVAQGAGGNPVQFSWAPPAQPVDGFVLEAGTATGLANIATVPLAGTATSFVVPGVPPGTYFVRLRARNACGVGAPSQEVVVTVGAACVAPAAPTLTASVNGSLASFVWGSAAGTPPITYTLIAGLSPGAANLATVPFGQATSFQIALPPGTYFVRIVASNACGTSAPSNEATLVVVAATGAPQLTFTITPNPVPFFGVVPGCAGSPIAQKIWLYTLRITNTGTGPFTIGSFGATVVSPLNPVPVFAPYPREQFALAFGGETIPPQGFLQGPLCAAGHFDDASLVWTFVDVGGAAFSTPPIVFLRSPF